MPYYFNKVGSCRLRVGSFPNPYYFNKVGSCRLKVGSFPNPYYFNKVGSCRLKVLKVGSFPTQCSAQVFKRAGIQFSKRAFSARCSMIKKALKTVISTFYQHFDDYFYDGHLFDSSLFICLTIGYKLMPNCFYFGGC